MAARAAQAPTKSNTNRPQPKKGLTARERRLVIKREGEPLDTNALDLRDDINQALAATYVQTVSLQGNTVVTGLFLSNENTIGPAVDLLALVLREASRDRR